MKKCPYCNVELEKIPQRKKKCPNCGNIIFVRTKSKKKLLFTEKGNKEYEERKNALSRVKGLGLTEEQFIQEKDKLSQKFGHRASDADTVWAIYHKQLAQDGKQNNYIGLHGLYLDMFNFRLKEGKLDTRLLAESHRFQLLDYKFTPWRYGRDYEEVVIRNADEPWWDENEKTWKSTCCNECLKMNGKKFSIDQALEEQPLPCKDCICESNYHKVIIGVCRCYYWPAYK